MSIVFVLWLYEPVWISC